jgi:hypothetical protein
VIGLLLWGSLPSNAQDVCFDESVASKIVVELERIPKLKEEIALEIKRGDELIRQRDTLMDTVRLQKEQVDLATETIKSQKQLAEVQDENCKKQIEAAKPSFWSRFGTHTAAFGIGGIIAAVLVLLL